MVPACPAKKNKLYNERAKFVKEKVANSVKRKADEELDDIAARLASGNLDQEALAAKVASMSSNKARRQA